jgi:ATP-dependent exoDNAse (exonuclease V) beta subunit
MEMRMASGSILRGIADLVVSFDGQFALIDHKSFPGKDEDAVQHAASFGGQLSAYAECFSKATGKKHLGSFVFLPLAGLIVELGKQKG